MTTLEKLLDVLTDQYLKLKARIEILETRLSANDAFVDTQLDEKDQVIANLEASFTAKVNALDVKVSRLEARIRDLEQPVFKPTMPWSPAPKIPEPWVAPTWPQWPPPTWPSVPIDPIPPLLPIQPYYESKAWCTACGLDQKNAASYCCMRVDCPSKAVSICTTTNTYTVDPNTPNTLTIKIDDK